MFGMIIFPQTYINLKFTLLGRISHGSSTFMTSTSASDVTIGSTTLVSNSQSEYATTSTTTTEVTTVDTSSAATFTMTTTTGNATRKTKRSVTTTEIYTTELSSATPDYSFVSAMASITITTSTPSTSQLSFEF